VLSPPEIDALLGALRTAGSGDRARDAPGGLRRCEVLSLELGDVSVGERRVHITCGKRGREREQALRRPGVAGASKQHCVTRHAGGWTA
jgi:hypothetical protein